MNTIRLHQSAQLKSISDDIRDGTCPACGEHAVMWDRHPDGYAYCPSNHGWRVRRVTGKWVPFSDTQNRAHNRVVGIKVEMKTGETIQYIPEID